MAKHVVLVPGFSGFDALGSLRYYAGVTEVFRNSASAPGNSIDYFDNFPTASVAQRAERLRKFLAKKWVRGEFQPGDELTLIGHSTGGLDIRRLLRDLRVGEDPSRPVPLNTPVDGCQTPVTASELRGLIRRIVFMSVPHFGTNIADFFHKLRAPIQAGAASAAEAVRRNTALPQFLSALSANVVGATSCELFDAIADTLRETDERADRLKRADEREARFDLLLWLDHMKHDLSALSDLRSYTPEGAPSAQVSPAFCGLQERQAELAELATPQPMSNDPKRQQLPPIDVLSFATRVESPAGDGLLAGVEHRAALATATLSDWFGPAVRTASWIVPGTGVARDAVGGALSLAALLRFGAQPARLFWHAHAICADKGLPFERPPGIAPGGSLPLHPGTPPFNTANITERDNDGIVNTLSMLWPYDPARAYKHYLVNSDHADIIGHYQGRSEPKMIPGGRENASYDIFQSGSGFTETDFRNVWNMVFSFAL